METAYELFGNTPINLQFNCDSFHLRKFNDQTKQYSDVVEKIDFGNYFKTIIKQKTPFR